MVNQPSPSAILSTGKIKSILRSNISLGGYNYTMEGNTMRENNGRCGLISNTIPNFVQLQSDKTSTSD